MRKTGQAAELACSFCGKHQGDVLKLIAGPSVFICDECIEACREIVARDRQEALDGVLSETPQSARPDTQGVATSCALCRMPVLSGDSLLVRERGYVCFGCLGEVEATLAEHRAGD